MSPERFVKGESERTYDRFEFSTHADSGAILYFFILLCATGVSQQNKQLARDRHGNPVRDLTAIDFQIAEQAGSHRDQQPRASTSGK
jgi:hypothetical protein